MKNIKQKIQSLIIILSITSPTAQAATITIDTLEGTPGATNSGAPDGKCSLNRSSDGCK
jgi:hypothetical protein